jgi:predicted RNA-binding Zn ribbon-like protein
MRETDSVVPPAPGAEDYLALDFVDSVIALPGGQFIDLLGAPAAADQWLAERGLAPPDAGLREMCLAQLRSLREQVRALSASRVAGLTALPAALSAINDALTRAPTAPCCTGTTRTAPTARSRVPPLRSSTTRS